MELPVSGDLDLERADALEAEARDLLRGGADPLVLDLRGASFLDSAGLRALLAVRNAAKRQGRGLVLVPGPPVVQRVFTLTGTRALFDWADAREPLG